MKKLLSILAAVGLTATASTAAVSCTTTISAKDVKVSAQPTDGYYTATWTENLHFNQWTKFSEVKKDNKVVGYNLMPYKFHLVRDTVANDRPGAMPEDLAPIWNVEGDTWTANPNLTFYTTDTSIVKKDNVDLAEKGSFKTDDEGTDKKQITYKCDGDFKKDIDAKVTITYKIPASYAGKTIRALLVRVEPWQAVAAREHQPGEHILTDSQITIDIPKATK